MHGATTRAGATSSQRRGVVLIQETIVNTALLCSSLFSNNVCYLNITKGAHNHTLATKTRKCQTILGFAQCMRHVNTYIPFFFHLSSNTHNPLPHKIKRKKMASSRPFTPAQEFSFNKLYEPSISSLDDFVSGPSTPNDGALLLPATISYPTNDAYIAKRGQDNNMYCQLMHRCRQLEDQLHEEKQNHSELKYIYAFLVS